MTLIRDLVVALEKADPAHPRLTWYGPSGERVELSGRVLVNTVVKATNMLVEDAEAGPGVRVALDMPPHWRTVLWALAAWTAGAEVSLARGERADVLVTRRSDASPGGANPAVVIAVPLAALALSYPGELPPGTIDGAADLMGYPDALGWLPSVAPTHPALGSLGGEPAVTHGELLTWARATADADTWPRAPRVLTTAEQVPDLLATALAAWSADGSAVLVADDHADAAHIAEQERTTVRR